MIRIKFMNDIYHANLIYVNDLRTNINYNLIFILHNNIFYEQIY